MYVKDTVNRFCLLVKTDKKIYNTIWKVRKCGGLKICTSVAMVKTNRFSCLIYLGPMRLNRKTERKAVLM